MAKRNEIRRNSDNKIALVIGGGVAGTTCAAELAISVRPNTHQVVDVVLIDPQPALKVSHIISELTRNAVDVGISEKDAYTWCSQHGITYIRDRVCFLKQNQAMCESGRSINFDTCCITTGARPFVPKVLENKDFEHAILTLRDTDSVARLKLLLKSARRVIIVGAGGIAMELAHEIQMCEVVWIVKGSHIGGSFFDNRGARIIMNNHNKGKTKQDTTYRDNNNPIQQDLAKDHRIVQNTANESTPNSGVGPDWLGKKDVAMLLDTEGNVEKPSAKTASLTGDNKNSNATVSEIYDCQVVRLENDTERNWKVIAVLTNGDRIGCDLVIAATGVIPNVEWITKTNIPISIMPSNIAENESMSIGGIQVNRENMETSISGIFAAGDCTSIDSGDDCNWMQMRLWSQAMTGGKVAAHGMLAYLNLGDIYHGLEFDIFSHVTHFFGKKVVLLGRFNAQGLGQGYKMYERCDYEPDNPSEVDNYVRVVVHNNKVRGCILIGDTDCAEAFENLILGELDVEWIGEHIVDPDIDLADYFD